MDKKVRMWVVLLVLWILLLAFSILASLGIIPNRTPSALQYIAIGLGILNSLIQIGRSR